MIFTESQAAAKLGLARLTLKRERKRGNIEYTLLGQRLIRYTQAQLDAYLESCRRRAPKTLPPITGMQHVQRRGNGAAAIAQAQALLRSRS